ncbi:MAG: hypothetical protein R3F54_31530 [Alphaproteobacteria bacterium]
MAMATRFAASAGSRLGGNGGVSSKGHLQPSCMITIICERYAFWQSCQIRHVEGDNPMNARPIAFLLVVLGVFGSGSTGSAADRHHAHHGLDSAVTISPRPVETGQSAFAAIAEIVAILEADPATDWSKVDLSALRAHLVDMDALTLEAVVEAAPLDGGLAMTITGDGRTRDAIQRMVPAHAIELDAMPIWSASAEITPAGASLTVTSPDPAIETRVRALGFFGLMATGSHHQEHHLAIARGEGVHRRH